MAWLRVGQASRVFSRLGDVIAVAAPRLLGHLPSTGDLGVNRTVLSLTCLTFSLDKLQASEPCESCKSHI